MPTTIVNIERRRGDTVPDIVLVKDESGTAVNITGFSFKMSVDSTEDPVDENTQLYKLTGTIVDALSGKVSFQPTAQQADQTPEVYYYDVEQVDGNGDIETILVGEYEYKQDYTKT